MPSYATTRHVRPVALASASFGLGLVGHLEAGGHATSPLAMVFAAGFCALSGWSYSRRRLSAPGLVAVLLANQVIMHLSLAIGSGMGTPGTVSADDDCLTGHTRQSVSVATVGTGPHDAAATAMHLIPDGWMILAHLVATLLTAGVLLAVQTLCLGLSVLAGWLARAVRVAFRAPLLLARGGGTVWAALPSWTSRSIGARPGRGPPLLRIAR